MNIGRIVSCCADKKKKNEKILKYLSLLSITNLKCFFKNCALMLFKSFQQFKMQYVYIVMSI